MVGTSIVFFVANVVWFFVKLVKKVALNIVAMTVIVSYWVFLGFNCKTIDDLYASAKQRRVKKWLDKALKTTDDLNEKEKIKELLKKYE